MKKLFRMLRLAFTIPPKPPTDKEVEARRKKSAERIVMHILMRGDYGL